MSKKEKTLRYNAIVTIVLLGIVFAGLNSIDHHQALSKLQLTLSAVVFVVSVSLVTFSHIRICNVKRSNEKKA